MPLAAFKRKPGAATPSTSSAPGSSNAELADYRQLPPGLAPGPPAAAQNFECEGCGSSLQQGADLQYPFGRSMQPRQLQPGRGNDGSP